MKRKTILTIAMCFFAVVVLFGVFYLNNPDIFSRDDGEESDQPNYMSMTRYPVNGGEVAHTFTAKGAVISNSRDVYVTKISVAYGKPDSFTMRAGRGEDISAGDVLYILDGTAVKSDINARVLEIGTNESGAEISLLNYDSLYAVLQIKAERLSEISYDTKVEVEIDGKKYPSQIRDIGFEVSGGNVMLAVSVPPKVLPGSEVNAIFTFEIKKDSLFVHANAVGYNGSGYFGLLLTDDGYQKVDLVIGEHFTTEENGYTYHYYEILAGVKEGDILVAEDILPSSEMVVGK